MFMMYFCFALNEMICVSCIILSICKKEFIPKYKLGAQYISEGNKIKRSQCVRRVVGCREARIKLQIDTLCYFIKTFFELISIRTENMSLLEGVPMSRVHFPFFFKFSEYSQLDELSEVCIGCHPLPHLRVVNVIIVA